VAPEARRTKQACNEPNENYCRYLFSYLFFIMIEMALNVNGKIMKMLQFVTFLKISLISPSEPKPSRSRIALRLWLQLRLHLKDTVCFHAAPTLQH
jgi:hypothetical protein